MEKIKIDSRKLQETLANELTGFTELTGQDLTKVKGLVETAVETSRVKPLESDVWIYRIVVLVLGLVVLSATLGLIFVFNDGASKIPETLTALGSGALGALAGLLAPSPQREN